MPETKGRWSDALYRTAYRLGFPLAVLWWRLRRRSHDGALVAIWVGDELLLLRSSYRRRWNLPGGSIRRGETPEIAARRELAEEIGVHAADLAPAGEASGLWEGRSDRVRFFEVRLDGMPALRLDRREIVGARLFGLEALRTVPVTGPVEAYLVRDGLRAPLP